MPPYCAYIRDVFKMRHLIQTCSDKVRKTLASTWQPEIVHANGAWLLITAVLPNKPFQSLEGWSERGLWWEAGQRANMGCGEEECLFVSEVCLKEAWRRGPGRSFWLRGRLGVRGEADRVALGESGLVPVRRPGFLGGNIGWISPRRLRCWEVCQDFPVPCRIWHQTSKHVGEVVYTKTFKANDALHWYECNSLKYGKGLNNQIKQNLVHFWVSVLGLTHLHWDTH